MDIEDEAAIKSRLTQRASFPVGQRLRDALWDEAFVEFWRLKDSGLSDLAAVQIFRVFLKDPDRKEAAELILETYGG